MPSLTHEGACCGLRLTAGCPYSILYKLVTYQVGGRGNKVTQGTREHVSERFGRLLALYRRSDGSEWGGQNLEKATGGIVTRS